MTKISEHIKNSKYMQVYIPRHVQEDMQLVRGVLVEWVKIDGNWVFRRKITELTPITKTVENKGV